MAHFVYVVFGLFLGFFPLAMKISSNNDTIGKRIILHFPVHFFEKHLVKIFLISLGILLLLLKRNLFFISGCTVLALLLSYKNKKIEWKIFVISLLFLILSSTLLWWYNENFSTYEWQRSVIFLVLSFCFLKILYNPPVENFWTILLYFCLFAFALLASIFTFSTGLYTSVDGAILHHWGAYVGPSQVLEAGGRIFYDIPAQYGLGPTALLVAIHKSNSWLELYYLNGIIILLYALLLVCSILVMRKGKNASNTVVFIIACFLTSMCWTGYPPTVTFTPMCPSVTGMRFLPVALLTLLLLLRVSGNKYFRSNIIIHFAWCFGVLWSPESAFYVTFVWWPYYLLLRYQNCSRNNIVHVVIQSVGVLVMWLLALLCTFIISYYAVYGVLPLITAFLEYAIHPPGPLPIGIRGSVWFVCAALLLGLIAFYKEFKLNPNKKETHYLFITILMAYAVSSYFFLARSHSNNILNISPMVLLSLVAIHSVFKTNIGRLPTNILIVSLISYSTFFGWQNLRESLKEGTLLQFNPQQLERNLLNEAFGVMSVQNKSDLKNAIAFVQARHEPLLVLAMFHNLIPSATDEAWSAIHGFANFVYVSASQRRLFLWNTMTRLQKTGWLLVEKGDIFEAWLPDYDTAYTRDQIVDFGSYFAIRFVPKITKK